uniref:Uncharacterized protein n=1 Tax=Rhizophora mucronata TaxID=61149 RepID=A0A2P2NQG8_RHIMU
MHNLSICTKLMCFQKRLNLCNLACCGHVLAMLNKICGGSL